MRKAIAMFLNITLSSTQKQTRPKPRSDKFSQGKVTRPFFDPDSSLLIAREVRGNSSLHYLSKAAKKGMLKQRVCMAMQCKLWRVPFLRNQLHKTIEHIYRLHL